MQMSDYDYFGHSHWNDFYQLPIEDGFIIDPYWIDYLWRILQFENPYSYHAAEKFTFIAIELIDLVWSPSFCDILVWPFTRPYITRVLCTVDTMLDSKQHLNDAYYGLIGDISTEIDSGTGVFSASLRKRCKAAGLIIGRETQRLESIMYKQLKVNENIMFDFCTNVHIGLLPDGLV
ncbi:uncharacterized protein EV420DRAFT_1523532 [Desarmillaria tabescens]|uniref:Uncharacterized protein n=1 Tax=Armillaria tabescens TaxID=1929756 RepID=A0AA39TYQ1_ARMTA|nr:uncharacterized protein EV420DRAFT_1523532 [Desarmillaria tabescens]KAK0463260.1 hypothetical protein EV420DRAFT_1523532 [Desarmillaria tabescens]